MSDGMQPLYDPEFSRSLRRAPRSVDLRVPHLGQRDRRRGHRARSLAAVVWCEPLGRERSSCFPRTCDHSARHRPAAPREDSARILRRALAAGPILTSRDVAEDVALAESVSMAMLVVLETLSPLERAVFVLREAFGMPCAEIADILGRKEEAVRQLGRRARDHVQERRSRFDTDESEQHRVTERFLEATSTGNLEALMAVLARSNARGRRRWTCARASPSRAGAEKVARFLLAVATEERMARFLRSVGSEPIVADLRVRVAQVNGGPGILVVSGNKPISALVLDVSEGVVRSIHLVANPEKLAGVRGFETS